MTAREHVTVARLRAENTRLAHHLEELLPITGGLKPTAFQERVSFIHFDGEWVASRSTLDQRRVHSALSFAGEGQP